MGAYYFAATLWALELRFYYFVILGWDWVWHGRCFMTFVAGAALDAEAGMLLTNNNNAITTKQTFTM